METDAAAKTGRVRVLFDASRLLARSGFSTPTGIDRVDLAYLRALETAPDVELHLVVFDRFGGRALSRRRSQALIDASVRHWEHFVDPRTAEAGEALRRLLRSPAGTPSPLAQLERSDSFRVGRVRARAMQILLRPAEVLRLHRLENAAAPAVYVNTSHGHLYRATSARWLAATGMGRVFMVHDLIPIEFPQYNRPREPDRHRTRLKTIAAYADHVLTNSVATAAGLTAYLRSQDLRIPPVTARHLGIGRPDLAPAAIAGTATDVPYFVCVGTLEPRKNHALLLDAWQQMIGDGEFPVPRLVLIGRRGWENQALFARLDGDPSFAGHIFEWAGLCDDDVRAVVAGARALLSPSFAEGFGLPVVEALACGTPAIVSIIDAHREIGGEFAEYLPPTETREWVAAIRDYAAPASERRRDRIERLKHYRPPSWDLHFKAVLPVLQAVARGPAAKAKL